MEDDRGVAGGPLDELAARVLGAWDALIALAEAAEGEAAEGEGLGELAGLGSWPDRPVLAQLMHEARTGEPAAGPAPRPDRGTEGRYAVLAALAEARQRTAGALEEIGGQPALGLIPLDSALGPLPLLTQIHAVGHELALTAIRWNDGAARDRAPGAAPELPAAITDAGVAALVDVVGALAHRQGLRASAGVWGPGTAGWAFQADREGWRTLHGPSAASREAAVPGVEGAAAVVLGVPAGRGALPSLLARGELKLHRIGGLMALAPLLEQVPGLPGGALLRRAAGMVGLLGRLPGMR